MGTENGSLPSVLTIGETLRVTRLPASTYYYRRASGRFPTPVRIGTARFHLGTDVALWLREQADRAENGR